MRKRSGQVHSRESSATLQLTVSLLYPVNKTDDTSLMKGERIMQSENIKLFDSELKVMDVEDDVVIIQ